VKLGVQTLTTKKRTRGMAQVQTLVPPNKQTNKTKTNQSKTPTPKKENLLLPTARVLI
jgi:hypothetical protein